VPGGVPGPTCTAIGPGPVQGRPVNGFLPNGGVSIVVLAAGETGTSGSWVTVFPLSIGLVVFPFSIGLVVFLFRSGVLVFCASAIVMVAVRPRTLRPISATRLTAMSDLPVVARTPRRYYRFSRLPVRSKVSRGGAQRRSCSPKTRRGGSRRISRSCRSYYGSRNRLAR